jgi:hypothetical protein
MTPPDVDVKALTGTYGCIGSQGSNSRIDVTGVFINDDSTNEAVLVTDVAAVKAPSQGQFFTVRNEVSLVFTSLSPEQAQQAVAGLTNAAGKTEPNGETRRALNACFSPTQGETHS